MRDGHRVVDQRFDAALFQVRLHLRSRRAEDRKEMVDVTGIALGWNDDRVRRRQRLTVLAGDRTAPLGPAREGKSGALSGSPPASRRGASSRRTRDDDTGRSDRRFAAASRASRAPRHCSSPRRHRRARRGSSSGRSYRRRSPRSSQLADRRTWPGAPGSSLRRPPANAVQRRPRSRAYRPAVRRGEPA